MIVKQCDRCGKVYKNNTKHTWQGKIISGVCLRFSNMNCFGNDHDLCDDCIGKLLEFLSSGCEPK